MTLFSTLAFLALSVHFGRQRGGEDWKGTGSLLPRSFLILNALNAFIGIFRQHARPPHANAPAPHTTDAHEPS